MGTVGRWFLVMLLLGALLVAGPARGEGASPVLVFDASAEGLPQAEIRAAIEQELGKPLAASSDGASGELSVGVDAERRLVVRYRTARGSIERYLPMPSQREDVPLIISLAAGNLARDQGSAVARPEPVEAVPTTLDEQASASKPAEAKQPAPTTAPPKASAATPVFKKHWLGIHVAQDIAFVYEDAVCHHLFGAGANFSCFYEGTDEPFFHHIRTNSEDIDEGPALATTRLLLSYDYAITPRWTAGTRLGYAFGGGPPSGQGPVVEPPEQNVNLLPAHTRGEGGTPFLPLHAELRGSFWFVPLDRRSPGAYVGAGFGIAQVDSKHSVGVRDCARTLEPDWNAAEHGTFEDCMQGRNLDVAENPGMTVDGWHKLGKGFVSANVGGMLPLWDGIGAVLNVNAMLMFPAVDFVLEPSLGLVAAL